MLCRSRKDSGTEYSQPQTNVEDNLKDVGRLFDCKVEWELERKYS